MNISKIRFLVRYSFIYFFEHYFYTLRAKISYNEVETLLNYLMAINIK